MARIDECSLLQANDLIDSALSDIGAGSIMQSAAAVIFVHNHPSGDPTPSAEDRNITARLRSAGDLLGIPVLDHVIITDNPTRYHSFADCGWS